MVFCYFIKTFLTIDEIKKTKSIELLKTYLTFKYKSSYFKCCGVAFRKNQLHPSKSAPHMYIEVYYQNCTEKIREFNKVSWSL